MKVAKVTLSIIILASCTCLNAGDQRLIRSFDRAMKTLEKKTVRALGNCNTESSSVNFEYKVYKKKRDRLVQKELQVKPRFFNKITKKALITESTCIKTTPSQAKSCFDRSSPHTHSAAASLT